MLEKKNSMVAAREGQQKGEGGEGQEERGRRRGAAERGRRRGAAGVEQLQHLSAAGHSAQGWQSCRVA